MNAALDCGTIDTETLSELIAMRDMKKHIQQIHPYAITKLKSGRWQTFYRDNISKKRKQIRTSTEEELFRRLSDLYAHKLLFDKMKLSELYEEWLDYKKTITESPNTIRRHKQHYARYFEGTKFFSTKLSDVTPIALNTFCNQLIKENNMTRQEWTNVKTILKGMFELAEYKEYIQKNPMNRLKITVRFRQVDRKSGRTETFNTDELKDLHKYLEQKYKETEDIALLAVEANTMMGLRVGELVALKWKDVDGNHLHICREEIRDQEGCTYKTVHHTKTRQDRYVLLIPRVRELLKRIKEKSTPKSDDDFIFVRDGNRLTSRQINYVLEKYAERSGRKKKSSHKLRKTYASILQECGVPLDEIRKQLGHTDLATTMAYVFNPLTDKETTDRIERAFLRTN